MSSEMNTEGKKLLKTYKRLPGSELVKENNRLLEDYFDVVEKIEALELIKESISTKLKIIDIIRTGGK